MLVSPLEAGWAGIIPGAILRTMALPQTVQFGIELEREADGRWIAEVPQLPGVMTYGQSRDEAMARVQALALRVLAERLEQGEAPEVITVSFRAA
jgi:predicted RNase H-like HicB family nuclease